METVLSSPSARGHLQQGLWARLGYREEWADERPNRNVRRFMNMRPLYQPQVVQTETVA